MNGNRVMQRWQTQNSAINFSGLLVLLAFVPPLIFAAWLVAGVQGPSLLWCADLGLLAGASGGAIASFVAAERYAGSSAGRAWAFIGAGMVMMAFGEAAWFAQELLLNEEVESPAVSDIGYLAFYSPVLAGLLMMPQAPVSGLRRVKLGLDLGVATAGISLISFRFVLADLVSGSGSLADWIAVAYPVGDLFLIGAAVVLVVRGGRNVTSMYLGLLALGFAAIGVTDSLYTYLSMKGEYSSGNYIDLGWMVAYGLIVLAAAGAARRSLNVDEIRRDEQRAIPVWQTLALNFSLVPVAAALFTDDLVVQAGFISLVGLALTSHLLTHIENARLNAQLHEMSMALQMKVRDVRIRGLLRHEVEEPEAEPPGEFKGVDFPLRQG